MKEISELFTHNGNDEIYNAIKNAINERCEEAKLFSNNLFQQAHRYLDPDLLAEIPLQFHARFWEMYLTVSLLEARQNLQHSHKRDGPDLQALDSTGNTIWIEAVTATPGSGKDAVKPLQPGTIRNVPDEAIKLRLLNAFDAKAKKYAHYLQKGWVKSKEPYIIAINAAQVPSARREQNIPRIVRSLLPFGHQTINFALEERGFSDISYQYQGAVLKSTGAEIETTSFLNPCYSGISAVIYSCSDVFNYPAKISNSLLVFHNPLAQNPIPRGFLKAGYEYWVSGNELKHKIWISEEE